MSRCKVLNAMDKIVCGVGFFCVYQDAATGYKCFVMCRGKLTIHEEEFQNNWIEVEVKPRPFEK
jgi:hypothetical protein